jgi:hypothetical protein
MIVIIIPYFCSARDREIDREREGERETKRERERREIIIPISSLARRPP